MLHVARDAGAKGAKMKTALSQMPIRASHTTLLFRLVPTALPESIGAVLPQYPPLPLEKSANRLVIPTRQCFDLMDGLLLIAQILALGTGSTEDFIKARPRVFAKLKMR